MQPDLIDMLQQHAYAEGREDQAEEDRMSVSAADFTRVPIASVLVPKTGNEVLVDHWWAVTPENEVLFYKGRSPQCNVARGLVERLLPEAIPGCEARLLPVAYIPHRCE